MRARPVTLVLAAMLVTACERDGPVALLRPSGPLMEIADASRDPGRVHFYFLPPMAAQPAYAGTFEASVLPHVAVEVCELAGAACGAQVARFTAAGRGLERVTASELFEHYLARWRTDEPTVRVGETYRVTVLVAGTALGYADVKVVQTLPDARIVDREQYAVAVKGIPLPIRFRIETGAVFLIGAAGGSVTAAGGVVQLDFPEGAVSEVVGITVAPATNLPADAPAPIAGTAFDFGRDGLQFAQPVRLSIWYDAAAVPSGVDQTTLKLHKLVGSEWVLVAGSSADVDAKKVSGDIASFSEYAVLPVRADPGLPGDIAFLNGDRVALMREDGSNAIHLTTNPITHGAQYDFRVYPDLVAWSATGDKLAFTDGPDLHIIGTAATDSRSFPGVSPDPGSLVWAPPGPRGDLFFTSGGRIFSVNSSAGAPEPMTITGLPLTRDPSGTVYTAIACQASRLEDYRYLHPDGPSIAVSPNGAHIAFTYRETCDVMHREHGAGRREAQSVAFANVATGQVISDVSEFNEFSHKYSSYFDEDKDADVVDAVDREIVFGAPYAWSPTDPNKIVVTAYKTGEATYGQLILVDIVARTVVPLLNYKMFGIACPYVETSICDREAYQLQYHGAGRLRGLAWSPAGDKLALAIADPGDIHHDLDGAEGGDHPPVIDGDGDGQRDYDIWVLDMSVTPRAISNLTANSEGDDTYPTWSPDGTKIAFVRSDLHGGNEDIYVLNVAQPGAQRLTVGPLPDISPKWRP